MKNELALETQFLPHLETAFTRGTPVLLTGAGFSLGALNLKGEPIPSAGSLTEQLWSLCYGNEPLDPKTQLQDVYDAAVQANRRQATELMKMSFSINVKRCPPHHRDVLTMPWARIYTLNVDDLAEKVLEPENVGRRITSISATTGRFSDIQDSALPIIHLNGTLDDVPDGVTFGRLQYAQRGLTDPFYQMLRHDLLSRPVIFIGTSLEEGPMWQHLVLRGTKPEKGNRELRPRSYLVTPSLNRAKEALLSQYNVELLQADAETFSSKILARLSGAKTLGNAYLRDRAQSLGRARRVVLRISELPSSTSTESEYLLGSEPTWADAKAGRIAERTCFQDILDLIENNLSSASIRHFLVVTGTAGTGKSSALRLVALRLEAKGIPTAWLDGVDRIEPHLVRDALSREEGLRVLIVADADLYERRMSRIVTDAMEENPRLLVVCECRSTRVDRIVDRVELNSILPLEFTIPFLQDADIGALLEVLTRENRLGFLRGKSLHQQRQIFEAEAGRQMLVAMYKATHGQDFKEKVLHECQGLSTTQQFLVGIVSVAHAHRFYVTKSELAIACGDDIEEWPRDLDALVRRKVILDAPGDSFKARHREIAQFVYDDIVQRGVASDVIRALIKISGTKTSVTTDRSSRSSKMLGTFINHRFLRRTVRDPMAREIYGNFESLLEWDHHFWLHRGALELESGNLSRAEVFLRTAKAIQGSDVFVDNELAYLDFKKANAAPLQVESAELVRQAIDTFEAISARRPDQRAHIYHIMGTQGLEWSQHAPMSIDEKRDFLMMLERNVGSVLSQDTDNMIATLHTSLRRAILSLAIE